MLIRIVKMEFHETHVSEFLGIFASSRKKIRRFPGCTHLRLLRSQADACVFFTYSHWEREEDLERYRNSGLFRQVWGETRKLFRSMPEAWSLEDQTEAVHRG